MTRLSRTRRLIIAISALAILLTACSNDTKQAGPAKITLSANGTSDQGKLAADSEMGIAPFIPYSVHFTYAGPNVDLSAPVRAWFFAPDKEIDQGRASELAKGLSIEGSSIVVPKDQGGGLRFGSGDMTGPTLQISNDAPQYWWYGRNDTGVSVPSCTVSDPSTGSDPAKMCEEPVPPSNVPDAAATKIKATEFLSSLGLDPKNYDIKIDASEWGSTATAFLILEGTPTTMSVSVSYGENGVVTWASGFLATPQKADEYPRIGVGQAVSRLGDQNAMFLRGVAYATDAAAGSSSGSSAGSATSTQDAVEASVETTASSTQEAAPTSDPVVIAPAPVDSTGPSETFVPEVREVVLKDATAILDQFWAPDNTVWLLPAYRFTGDDEGTYQVLAVPDEYINTESEAKTTDTTESSPQDSTVPAPTEVPVPTSCVAVSDSSSLPPAPDTADAAAPELSAFDPLLKLCLDDASFVADAAGYTLRVVRLDGVDMIATADYSANRINVAVEDGVVVEIVSLG